MPDLRRRAGRRSGTDNNNGNNTKATPTQAEPENKELQLDADKAPSLLAPLAKLKNSLGKPRGKRRHSFVFLLGGLFGIFVALFFANQNEVISLDALLDLNLDSLIDVMPSGLLSDAKEFTVGSCPNTLL
jgi:phospholipid:diacylglycerol acyltransferase